MRGALALVGKSTRAQTQILKQHDWLNFFKAMETIILQIPSTTIFSALTVVILDFRTLRSINLQTFFPKRYDKPLATRNKNRQKLHGGEKIS